MRVLLLFNYIRLTIYEFFLIKCPQINFKGVNVMYIIMGLVLVLVLISAFLLGAYITMVAVNFIEELERDRRNGKNRK